MFESYAIQAALPDAHGRIIDVLPEWWGGRDLTSMVPRVFLLHFHTTSLIVELKGELIAFLIGFDSQSFSDEAYIHFMGVHPDHRGLGIGRHVYGLFFDRFRQVQRPIVRCCTSPVNRASIEFHERIGFELEVGDEVVDGIPIFNDYNKSGDPKVRFRVIPKGVEHKPTAEKEAHVLIVEPKNALNTGDVQDDMALTRLDWI